MGLLSQLSLSSSSGKWLGFVTAVWVQAISGNNYTFSNYSDALKSIMSLTQLQLNTLSVAKDLGKAFGLLAGLSSDRIPTSLLFLIGGIEGLIGYGVQWLVVSQKINPIPYWQMCIFMCLGGNSTTWMNTAVLVTCIRNFRKNRGPVSGILKGYVGLSTAIFTNLCSAVFDDKPASFLLMLAIIPLVVCIIAAVFLHEIPPSENNEDDDTRYFALINSIAVVIAVYLLLYDVTGTHSHVFSIVFVIILLIFLVTPLGIPIFLALRNLTRPTPVDKALPDPEIERTSVREPLLERTTEEEAAVFERRVPVIGEDHTIMETIRTVEFWILFLSFLCGVGPGLTVMNNMGQMGLALGYTDVSIFVSLLSIFGFFGRILSGWITEYYLKKAGTPRPIWNAASQIVMTVGFIILAIAFSGSLYIGSIVVGICYGIRIAVTVPTASELFGLKYYGLIYNVLILDLPIGSLLFSDLLAGILYDSQATTTAAGENTCTGGHCYRLVYVVLAFTSLVGFGLDILLSIRTKGLYAKICASKKLKGSDHSNGN
ncbi:protein NUCLEAR FUSION DEFECTIVE 4-like [Impatiens glandulifera]|uniref:protein NUCLEAR FUSION DEFECTIVE 4-like n=1 Tax=Impatiens glandulifera TaxID=253017 RepID=UPI001FB0C296|nr:protein NUCLEAR FUSION DEFECTIVE 4-like [Impatiens glandulifera]